MRSFKVGDLVRVKSGSTTTSRIHLNKILKIKDLRSSKGKGLLCKNDYAILECSCPDKENGCGGIWFREMELYNKPNTEIDILDSFKNNEKSYYE